MLWASPSQAYYETLTTGNLLERGQYAATGSGQFITSGDDGFNVVGMLDSGLTADSNLRAVVGFGTTDFHLGGYYKWVPIPDVDNQPAVGIMGGVVYARHEQFDELSLRFHPLISKAFEVEVGDITPYASLPFSLRSVDGDFDVPLQAVVGAELKTFHYENIKFISEIGFDVSKSFTYFSIGMIVGIDQSGGVGFY